MINKQRIDEEAALYVEEWHLDMGWVPTDRSCIPSLASFTAGANFAAEEIISKASEGFEEFWKKERGDLVLEPSSFITIKESEQYEWEKQAWQAARLSSEKEIQQLKQRLAWYHDRLILVYGENYHLDYHINTRAKISAESN